MRKQPKSSIQATVVLWVALAMLLPARAVAFESAELGLAPGQVHFATAPHVAAGPASHIGLPLGDPPPDIEVWYGLGQSFGDPGKPQRWINILGNVFDADGIKSLKYSINGGNPVDLTVGPDGYRLVDQGDFNADPDFADFDQGMNEVVITAQDNDNRTSSVTVNVEVDKTKTWPLPYAVDWGDVTDLQTAAQIVDGLWDIQNGLIHTSRPGYDRLVAIGDTTWTDYEVTVPVTIHEFFAGKKGVGVAVRWNGHGDDNDQPHYEHPLGGLGWYRYSSFGDQGGWLEIWGNGGAVIDEDQSVELALNTPYIFKMQVETLPNGTSFYRLKVWRASDSEPGSWSLSGNGNIPDVDHGSILLVANHADASFGRVTITPLSDVCYSLTPVVDPVGSGTIDVDPAPNCGLVQYTPGTEVTLTAQPSGGNYFGHWSGDASGTSNPTTITMDGDRTAVAHFAAQCFSLTTAVDPAGGGAVTAVPAPNCGDQYTAGTQVELTAEPASGYGFSNWSGDAIGDANPKTITMVGDTSVTAHFTDQCYSLNTTIDPSNGGAIAVDPPPNCGAQYAAGTEVELTAQPAGDYVFKNWSGSASGTSNPTTITMSADRSVTAHFDHCHTLTSSIVPPEGGLLLVDPAPDCGPSAYTIGTQVTLTAQPEAYYNFDHWSGDASGNLNPATVTMDADHSVTAHFTQPCYTLATQADPVGGGEVFSQPTPNCDNTLYTAGTKVRLRAVSGSGYLFSSWSGDLEGSQTSASVTIDGDKSITAHFELVGDCFTLTTAVDPSASGAIATDPQPNCSEGRFMDGTEVQITAQPALGYGFSHWSGDASTVEATTKLVLNSDRSVTAHFVERCYALTTASVPVGAGTVVADLQPDCSGGLYSAGMSLTLTATPRSGYLFQSWGGATSGSSNPTGLTMGGDLHVIANFQEAPVGGRHIYVPLALHREPTPAQLQAPLLEAINNADGDGAYTVSWSAVRGAASYLLQEAADASFAGAITLDQGSATSLYATGRSSGLHYYRVKARNVVGGESPWSNVRWVSVP